MAITESYSDDRDTSCSAFELLTQEERKRLDRKLQLNNLFRKLDEGEATPHKTRKRIEAAGHLAAKELLEKS